MYCKTSDKERVTLGFCDNECNNGTHFCGFYETDQERDDIILGYIRHGLTDNNCVLYTPNERTADDFSEKFCEKYPGEEGLIHENPHLTINTAKDLYFPDGSFSPEKMDKTLKKFFEKSQEKGKINIRTTAEMTWALDMHLDKTQLMAYESRLNYFIPGKPWISICLYNLTKFDGRTIMQVLQTHPYSISKDGMILKNPYYIHPDVWLAQNAPEFSQCSHQ